MGYVIEYDYDYKSSENYDYNYDYDYLKKCNQLQSNTIAITITPALSLTASLWYLLVFPCGMLHMLYGRLSSTAHWTCNSPDFCDYSKCFCIKDSQG